MISSFSKESFTLLQSLKALAFWCDKKNSPVMYYATPEQALAIISNGESIWSHSMAATPYSMLDALAQVARDKQNLTLLSLHTEKSGALCAAELAGHLRQRVFFVGRPTRPAVNCGNADYVPAFLSEIPKPIIKGLFKFIAFIRVK